MSDKVDSALQSVDDIVRNAMRQTREAAFAAAIELCEAIRDEGGCATCCVNELTKLRNALCASHASEDFLAKVFKR